ncbi:orotidine-5'-phosphate decarboxylase [Lentibacillus sp. L22]|uniref:orotidine-5'-phosphate decarboxylase n=1 Tax=Lentibacillus TaxID=175304 RepID=UPI0022B166FB|nr:orotidine-5'-phosphate decarboxylase [Lentibacillus daqui]
MNNNIYLALDFPTWMEAKAFIDRHNLNGVPVKVGMELFYREGPYIIEQLKKDNHAIFLDLKLHDIPTTVKKAMQNLTKLDVDLVNVHALGGGAMIQAAKEGLLASSNNHTKLLAVTMLTSMEETVMNEELRISGSMQDNVVHLAAIAKQNGADGVVCSVHEASQLKTVCGLDFLTVTPGIRLQESNTNDQKRVATPSFAREHGADILVVGRAITNAQQPKQAYINVLKEWNNEVKS